MTPLTTPGRWLDPTWRQQVLAWADTVLERHGRRRTGWTQPHVRPWSTVLRLEVADGDAVWLKANGEGTRHEAALLAVLAALDVPHTPRPLAADEHLGLALMPDGGPTAREAHGGSTPLEVRSAHLAAYAQAQRATEAHVDRLLAAGVPDLRPEAMPAALESLVDRLASATGPARLDADVARRLLAVLPAYAEACAELAGTGVAPTLQHDDLHDANVFERGPVLFDWGDAVVGHPFGTLLAALGSAAHHLGLRRDDPALAGLADAYTAAWTDVADRRTLRRAVRLAVRVGPLSRALAWERALDGSDDGSWARHGEAVPGWLEEVLSDDLPLHPDPLA